MDNPYNLNRLESVNSFNDYDLNATPKGSVHTTNAFDEKNGGLVYKGSHQPSAQNKIRVVIRMRPLL